MCGVAADDLPVDFVEVIGLQDDGTDDAAALGGAHPYFYLSEEEVEVGLDCGSIAL